MTTLTQTQNAQTVGQYNSTSVDTLKSSVDFTINQMNPIFVTFKSGEGKIVTRKELAKMQNTMTWATNF